jgi:hypothetical protein
MTCHAHHQFAVPVLLLEGSFGFCMKMHPVPIENDFTGADLRVFLRREVWRWHDPYS